MRGEPQMMHTGSANERWDLTALPYAYLLDHKSHEFEYITVDIDGAILESMRRLPRSYHTFSDAHAHAVGYQKDSNVYTTKNTKTELQQPRPVVIGSSTTPKQPPTTPLLVLPRRLPEHPLVWRGACRRHRRSCRARACTGSRTGD